MTEPGNPSKNPDDNDSSGESVGKADDGTPEFGSPFDYDATAEASLSSQGPGSSDPTPAGSGPGWDTYSGVGNGPGWGNTPTYPSPGDAYPSPGDSTGPVYGAPDPNLGQQQYGQQAPGFPSPGQPYPGYGQPGYSPIPGGYVDPMAPFGRHPQTGEPYSDKSKVTAGVLELLLGAFGAGRFYLNQPGIAIAQIAVTWLTCGLGAIWPLIDGIMMLVGNVRDKDGRPLRD
ncbi:MAG: NINE protein [Rhodococcus sp.]|nr:NINE protein [Rhodococcus sp. (in: high G+C Gram-positive bacteria)]